MQRFELIAEGKDGLERLRVRLQTGRSYLLGRGERVDVRVPWEPFASRQHARLTVRESCVELQVLPSAKNPVFYQGHSADRLELRAGEHFVIGDTVFYVVAVSDSEPAAEQSPVQEFSFSRQELQQVRFRDANKQIEVLTHLPEVIGGSRSDSDLYYRLAGLLLAGIPHAEAVAVVRVGAGDEVQVLHWDRRHETEGSFRPSSRLVREALKQRRNSVLHVWKAQADTADQYTAAAEFDWAFCTPVPEPARFPWGLYVAGRLSPLADSPTALSLDPTTLQADVKFTELLAEVIGSVRRVNRLERQQAGLRQFFAPAILSAIGDELNTELLEPRECEVAVLFCDLRGFSRRAEREEHDLLGLLSRVSQALGVMTHHISQHGGVIGDFQGDAALGFWGWPLASESAAVDACRAALGIRRAFQQVGRTEGHPLQNFQMGIGIAHGRAVAGKIGTEEQVKVTVFGPVVNLASRLESMTRQLRVPVLLDENTARIVREKLPPSEGRIRRLARVQPAGMDRPVLVSELLPPESEMPELTDEHLRQFEEGVDHFLAGRWEEAYRCFHGMPASDRAQDFLMLLITQHNRVAPDDWDGVVRLQQK